MKKETSQLTFSSVIIQPLSPRAWQAVLRILLILKRMQIRILNPHLFLSLIFMLKLNKPFKNLEIFITYIFSSLDLEFESKFFIGVVFGWYFADPDPGSQNHADPTDPNQDPKHCWQVMKKLRLNPVYRDIPSCIYP